MEQLPVFNGRGLESIIAKSGQAAVMYITNEGVVTPLHFKMKVLEI